MMDEEEEQEEEEEEEEEEGTSLLERPREKTLGQDLLPAHSSRYRAFPSEVLELVLANLNNLSTLLADIPLSRRQYRRSVPLALLAIDQTRQSIEVIRDTLEFALHAYSPEVGATEQIGYIYLEEANALNALLIVKAIQEMNTSMGFTPGIVAYAEAGSVKSRIVSAWDALRSNPETRRTATEIVETAQRLALLNIEKQQAKVDAINAGSIETILSQLDDQQNATVKNGSVLIRKSDGHTDVRVLNARERNVLDRYPQIMNNPADLELSLEKLLNEPEDFAP